MVLCKRGVQTGIDERALSPAERSSPACTLS